MASASQLDHRASGGAVDVRRPLLGFKALELTETTGRSQDTTHQLGACYGSRGVSTLSSPFLARLHRYYFLPPFSPSPSVMLGAKALGPTGRLSGSGPTRDSSARQLQPQKQVYLYDMTFQVPIQNI